jgi:proteasome activator subunit 4
MKLISNGMVVLFPTFLCHLLTIPYPLVPSDPEIEFVLQILDEVATPALIKIEQLLESVSSWDNADRNDFCRLVRMSSSGIRLLFSRRFMQASKSIWAGLPTFLKEQAKDVQNQHMYDTEVLGLLVTNLDVEAGFTLRDPTDPRYQKVSSCRTHFGQVVLSAARGLRQRREGEDHIDAVISVSKAIDVYLLDYGISKSGLDALTKSYSTGRE